MYDYRVIETEPGTTEADLGDIEGRKTLYQ
jgi:hypothetical protein